MLSFIKGLGLQFRQEVWQEETALDNPGRGWYRIYTYQLGQEREKAVRYPGETLALVLVDIGGYAGGELGAEALHELRSIFEDFVCLGMEMVVRICYDTEGKGMVKEPSLFSLVQKHMEELAPVLAEYAQHIFVYQGLLIGNWGEMHGSKFLTANQLRSLIDIFRNGTGGKVRLALRRPVQLRMAYGEGQQISGVGFFDDAILASETHLGTFACDSTPKGAYQEVWPVSEEIEFMKSLVRQVPFGGEALFPEDIQKISDAPEELKRFRVSYLNAMHDSRLLDRWKQEKAEAGSLFDSIGERLGYRLTVTAASWKASGEVQIEIENSGFGPLYENCAVTLYSDFAAKGEPLTVIGEWSGDLAGLDSGEAIKLCILSDKEAFMAGAGLYLDIRRKKDSRQIRLSQRYAGNYFLLGTLCKIF